MAKPWWHGVMAIEWLIQRNSLSRCCSVCQRARHLPGNRRLTGDPAWHRFYLLSCLHNALNELIKSWFVLWPTRIPLGHSRGKPRPFPLYITFYCLLSAPRDITHWHCAGSLLFLNILQLRKVEMVQDPLLQTHRCTIFDCRILANYCRAARRLSPSLE